MEWKNVPLIVLNFLLRWNRKDGDTGKTDHSSKLQASTSSSTTTETISTSAATSATATVSLLIQIMNQSMIIPMKEFMINHDILPKSQKKMTKMLYMELWRHFWNQSFKFL